MSSHSIKGSKDFQSPQRNRLACVARTLICLFWLLALTACTGVFPANPSQPAGLTITPTPTGPGINTLATETGVVVQGPCPPVPVIVPTSAPDPGYTQLDPSTGLHMTGRPQTINLETYQLKISGKVDRPLNLSYDDLRCLPRREVKATLICPGYFEDVATWGGARLSDVLNQAGLQPDAKSITMKGADGYSSFALLKDVQSEDNLIAYEWKNEPLPILHGFPIRMVLPSLSGGHWVKWLVEIVVE
jgi:DMSO/TMAO reductase YedYZ molybdopterin-dependent catalytic subunit